jgi:hypothetical protein
MAKKRTRTASFSALGIPSTEELEEFAAEYEYRSTPEDDELRWDAFRRHERPVRGRQRRKAQARERGRMRD